MRLVVGPWNHTGFSKDMPIIAERHRVAARALTGNGDAPARPVASTSGEAAKDSGVMAMSRADALRVMA